MLLNKTPDITSFQALGAIKRQLPGVKVGHAGTLDRFAEGLLVVLCGRMTRLTPTLTGLDKEYRAEFFFGKETTTLDPEGEVIAEGEPPLPTALEEALPAFRGAIEQVPPQYSAVHVDGERAYRTARKGKTVTIAPRAVTIYALELESYRPPLARLRIRCSSGTYVRALARDLGRACGSRAHVTRLLRTRVGPFAVEEAVDAEGFLPERDLRDWHHCLSRIDGVQEVQLKTALETVALRGGHLDDASFVEPPHDGRLAAYGSAGQFLALLSREGGKYRYELVNAPRSA